MQELNNKIKASGIKKAFIAEKLGISKQHFSNKIKGRTPFSIKEAIILSHILELSSDEFFYFFAYDSENVKKHYEKQT